MKRIYLLLLTGIMIAGIAGAQVTVTGADAATNAASPFTTLRAAFVSINASAQTANTISITIIANTIETASAVLNQSTGPWTSMSIRPGTGATVTISGAIAVPLIDLDGADNVTIDGSNNGSTSKDMTISNTDLGGTAIRFINDATTNTVKNCIVQSVNASPTSGTILFSTSTGTSGNSSNIINNCDIRDGATVPINAVYSSGSAGAPNATNTISGCRIFNFSGSGVLVSSTGAGNGWTINPTSFYQTASRTTAITVISLQGGSGHTLSSNSFGGAASDRSGIAFTTTSTFTGISLAVGTASATSVQGNTLSNLNISGGSTQTFKGITVTSGNVNIGTTSANTIGGLAAAYDTVRTNYDADMIENSGAGIVNIENNLITNVSYYNASGDRLFGIRGTAGTVSIKNNIIHDLKSNGSSTGFSFFPGGIWLATAVAGANVEGNQVYNIAHTNTGTSAYTIAGIYVSGVSSTGTPTTIRKNKVYGITAVGTGTGTSSPRVWGIHVASGSATYTNNMVSVGTGSGLETRINGMEDLGTGTNNYYFNSVYTSGTTSAGSNNSYAFNRSVTTTVELRNNIFSNTRTGGTGFHVAIANTNAAATGWSATASNYNDLHSSTSGSTAQWLGTAVGNNRDLTGWQAAQASGSGGDANSVSFLPGFVSVTDLHIPAATPGPLESGGIAFGGITTDIDNDTRPGPSGSTNGGATAPDMGADEFDGTPAANMTYVSSTTIQGNTSSVNTNTTNQEVIGIQIVTAGALSPLSATSFTINTNGTTTPATDITNAKLWYTGTTATFATTTQFGSTVAAPNGSFPVTGSQTLQQGTNYFWLTYDVPCTAVATEVIDAECNSLTVVSAQTPTLQAPVGSRTIVVATISGTKTVGSGGDYATLTDAAAAINTGGLSGNTTLSILNSLTETAMVTFNQWTECGAGNYTLTIKPAATVTATISASSTTAVIKLNGADRVIIDGSNNGTSSKDMTITNTNTGTSSAVIWIASASVSDGATNNTVKNCIITGNASTTTLMGIFSGGTASISTSGNALVSNTTNTIQNNTISKSQYGIFVIDVSTTVLGSGLTISGNTIGTSTTGDGFNIEGLDVRFQNGAIVSGNDVQNVKGTSSTTMYGIRLLDFKNGQAYNNKVHNLNYSGTSTTKLYGLAVQNAGYTTSGDPSQALVYNNLVYDITSSATSSVWNTTGMFAGQGYGDKYYFNSIHLTGQINNSTSGLSAAFANGDDNISTFGTNLDVRNNIFNFAGSSASGNVWAYYSKAVSLSGTTQDNNVLRSAGTGATNNTARLNNLNYTTIAAWTAASSVDATSIESDPLFNSGTNLTPQTGSPVVGAGVTGTSITTDITGFTRNSPPTIGAYEQTADVTGPTITYSLLGGTLCNTDITFSPVTITDGSGVNTTVGTKPRLYFKKSTDANTYAGNTNADNGWKYAEASNASSPFSFTTNYALLQAAVTGGDVIQYFVTAQDLNGTPNVSINSGVFNSTPTSVALAAGNFPITGTINSYLVSGGGLSGTVNVGPGETYTTLTAAGGLFATLNTGGLTGNLTANITGNITTEDGVNALNAINYGCAGPYTLTIKTTGTFTVSGTNSGGLIRLNGADYVTIDGSTGSTANTVCPVSAASRDLTITNTNSGTSSAIIWLQTATADGATNNTVKNCNLAGNSNTTTLFAAGSGSSTVSTSSLGTGNNSNSFINNNISKTQYGIYSQGASSGNKNTGTVINQNLINTVSPNNVSKGGIWTGFENTITISGNTISEITQSSSPDVFGISLGVGTSISTSSIGTNEVTNATVTNNVIGTVTNTGTFSAAGIAVAAATSGTTLIANNMLSGVNANGTSPDFAAGILLGGGTGSATNVYFNTVTMTGTLTGGAFPSYALAIHGTTDPVIDLKNNILTSTGSTGANLNRAIGINSATFTNLTSNNNDLFASGTGSAVGQTVNLTNTGATSQTTLTDWQTATGKDAASKNVQPSFVSATNLHLVTPDATNNVFLESQGAVVSVTTDIDCATRPSGGAATAPDIGADEFAGATPACVKPVVTAISSITTTTASVALTCLSCTGTYIVEYGPITPYWAPGTVAGAGSGSSFVQAGASSPIAISGLTPGTPYKVYVRQVCAGPLYSDNSDSTNLTTFATLCNATTVPYIERFDSPTIAPAIPTCITVENVNGGNTWRTVTNLPSGDDPASYHNFMRIDYETDGITPADDWFYTRPITLTGGTSYRLRFHYRNSDGVTYTENLEVKYGTANNAASMTLGTLFSHTGINSNAWKDTLVDFTPAVNGDYYIGFHGFSAADQAFLCVDNVSVIATPTCNSPVDVTVGSISSTGAVVSFNAPGGTALYLEYGPLYFTPGTGATAGGGTVIGPIGSSPITIPNGSLVGETYYDVYVRQDCGGSNFSPNSLPRSFRTGLINDDAPGAYTLTAGAGCTGATYSNVGASASTGEVFPSCSGTISAPVWFKFVAPASGAVRISTDIGSGNTFTDSKVGLFSASNVNDYTTFTILSCDDDGGSVLGSGFMSVVFATGLTGGTTYYIAVDKYSTGTTNGLFCITVDELSSGMLAATNTCASSYQTPLGSNAAYAGWQPLVDASSKLVALVRNPTGGEVDDYSVAENINTAAVRTDASTGQRYLDRNFMINNSGGATNVDVKLFFLHSELTALQATDPVVTLANLGVTRQTGSTCDNDFVAANGTNSYIDQNGNGSVNGADWIQFNTPAFSKFELHTSKAFIPVKVFLQGAMTSLSSGGTRHKDVNPTWAGILNANALTQPYTVTPFSYSGTESVSSGFFTSTSDTTNITDWVLVELRDATTPATVLKTRAAFIREDGRIVDLNGIDSLSFRAVTTGSYYFVVRHRNHLLLRTSTTRALDGALGSTAPALYDFSDAQSRAFQDPIILALTPPNNNAAMKNFGNGVFAMWAGNTNSNANTRLTGLNSDAAALLAALSGNQGGNLTSQYSRADVNLDGTVKFTGLNSDAPLILAILAANQAAVFTQHQ